MITATQADEHFRERLASHADAVEVFLNQWLSVAPGTAATVAGQPPQRLMAAMRHGVLNGGKRFRPFLVLECAALAGPAAGGAMHVAGALECIHSYSLVHDDLPAMDDDDLRRGKPTVHKAYDEATAILAGDALLTEAFSLVAASGLPRSLEIIAALAAASGAHGMVGGQLHDLMQEGASPDEAAIVETQAMKTGALIRVACEAGGLAAGLDASAIERLKAYGAAIGLAFQLSDDLLDATASSVVLGKTAGKDAKSQKGTLLHLHGEQWARERLAQLVEEAAGHLEPFGDRGAVLSAAARFVAWRDR